MNVVSRLGRPHFIVFLATFVIGSVFAIYTDHVWEDYYITFRASKNLATGHGLVFNHGDRLHTFTSPLGVLLPALTSVLTLNQSDTAALWLFRLTCVTALAGATTLLYACVLHVHRSAVAAAFAAACLGLDPKSVDFTINGMETGFLLLFVALTLWAQFGRCSRRWLWLGLAWGGLMWTRPDGFLYIGLLSAGGWLFNRPADNGATRGEWLKTFGLAALVCTAIYLPWFIGSWAYYGTPIPHTITAKGMISGEKTVLGALQSMMQLPLKIGSMEATSAPGTFLPAYFMFGGWPVILIPMAKVLAFVAAFVWIAPFVSHPVRAVSFAFFGLHVYLSYFPYFPFPWYLPGTAILAFFVFAGLVAQLLALAAARERLPTKLALKAPAFALLVTLLASNLWQLPAVAAEMRTQQQFIENGTRQKVGEWLHQNAAAGDTVFLEPLGYIGYFSQLKTYDFPGLSSREMLPAVELFGNDWPKLIDYLWPDWLVLRPNEVDLVTRGNPGMLGGIYQRVAEFDVLDQIKSRSVHGRSWLEFDARFAVYRREPLKRIDAEFGTAYSLYPIGPMTIGDRSLLMVHAPSRMLVQIPAGARSATIPFGMPTAAAEGEPKTDGAAFEVRWSDGGIDQRLSHRQLNPGDESDRGLQTFQVDLPVSERAAHLILKVNSRQTSVKDWTCWGKPEFR